MKWSLRIGSHEYGVLFHHRQHGRVEVAGITNRCADGSYVLFLDYDDLPFDLLIDELMALRATFCLGDLHILKTGRGFHVVCTQKFTFRQLLLMMRSTSTDEAFIDVPLRAVHRMWTLRLTEKGGKLPEALMTLKGIRGSSESRPHNEILRKVYNFPITSVHDDKSDTFWSGHYFINERENNG